MAEGCVVACGRSSLLGYHGTELESERAGMGAGDYHDASCRNLVLLHEHDHVALHHEVRIFYLSTIYSYILTLRRHPQIMDICDFGYYAFGKQRWAYHFTAFMLLANNIMLIGFHILTGAKVINTLSDHSLCTVTFSVIVTLMGIVMSLPRTLRHISFMSMFSAACMGIAILLFLVFVGIEDAPGFGYLGNYPEAGPVKTYALPPTGTTFVAAMNAVLNITFLWVPQILFPTFIAEMEKPEDFPKSLAVLAVLSAVLFIVPPAIGFRYLGQYATAPAFGSLGVVVYKKASFAFVIVPTLVIGVSSLATIFSNPKIISC